jgi:thiol-disulfide isomerase/thioredoxin
MIARRTSPSRAPALAKLALAAALAPLALGACDHPSPSPSAQSSASAAQSASPQSATAQAAAQPAVKGPLIEWAPAPEGDVAALVKAELERAKKDGRTLLVYVGATWCEPCQRFHQAAEAGEITGDLPPLRMLEFDLDRDVERLAAAGYGSRLIPLFAVPAPDGRGTDVRIEGSIKGSGAVSNIVPRLRSLLARAKGS